MVQAIGKEETGASSRQLLQETGEELLRVRVLVEGKMRSDEKLE